MAYIGRVSVEKGIDLLFKAISGIPLKLKIFGAIDYNVVLPENVEYYRYVPHDKNGRSL